MEESQHTKENYIVSPYAKTWLDNGVVIQEINKNVTEIDLAAAQQLVADRRAASGENIPRPVLVIGGNAVSINKEAGKYYRQEEPYINLNAMALFVDNWVTKTVAGFVFSFKRNPVPLEFFNDKTKALKWLEKYKTTK